ncbi:MAG: (d)CMP kinase [Clostridiales bacterium]|nr:MAG: (d)CMP kinase [Clostridiales bacterium]
MPINIAIDGPSGSGKSTQAKELAKKLSYIYVDTGALYRAIGFYVMRKGVDTKDEEAVKSLLPGITVLLKYVDGVQRVILNDEDVSDLIRTQPVSMAASDVSRIPEVRAFLLDLQREIASTNNVIMDGRDVGTVILPNAQVKIFLTASPEDRAMRRFMELKAAGKEDDDAYERILSEIVERDKNDTNRQIAPLKQADDAVLLDNTGYEPEETMDALLNIIRSKLNV